MLFLVIKKSIFYCYVYFGSFMICLLWNFLCLVMEVYCSVNFTSLIFSKLCKSYVQLTLEIIC